MISFFPPNLCDSARSGRGNLVLTSGFGSRHLCSGGHSLTHCIKSPAAAILLYRNNGICNVSWSIYFSAPQAIFWKSIIWSRKTIWNLQRKLHFFNENHKEITLLRNSSNAIEKCNCEAAEKTSFGASRHTENVIFWTKKQNKKLVFMVFMTGWYLCHVPAR